MIEAFVADASIAIAWVHPAQATEVSAAWLSALEEGALLVVPSLWSLEVANALVVLTRRGKLTKEERKSALERLGCLTDEVDVEGPRLAFTRLEELADEHSLSVYDAVYFELALRRQLPLACKDGPLHAAAKKCKIKVAP